MNNFPDILRLYNQCRSAGIWARMALKTENGKKTITFSSVTRPQGSTFSSVPRPQGSTFSSVPRPQGSTFSSVPRPQGSTFSSVPRPQVQQEGKQKKPSKIRKDKEIIKEAWLAKKILAAAKPTDQQPDKPETETGFVNTAFSTYNL